MQNLANLKKVIFELFIVYFIHVKYGLSHSSSRYKTGVNSSALTIVCFETFLYNFFLCHHL